MQDMPDIIISQILSSRLCHDLIAPLSAVKTGLELLEESQTQSNDPQILDLIMQSTENVARRLSFFRFAFGYSALTSIKSLDDARTVIENYFDPKKHQLSWRMAPEFMSSTETVKYWSKLIVNLIAACVDATPYGGTFEVRFDEANNFCLRVEAQTAKLQAAVQTTLEQGCACADVTVHTVQAYLCYFWLQKLGKRLLVEDHPGQLLLRTIG